MTGFLSGSEFGWKVALRFGIFVGLTLAFPFIIYGIVLATGAHRTGGAGGAVATAAGVLLKPAIIVVFLISLILPSLKRARTLGIFPAWGLMIPLLFAMDRAYLFAVGNFWGASFSVGILAVQTPIHAMTALALMVAMTIAEPPSGGEPSGFARFGFVGQVFKTLAIAILIGGLIVGIYTALAHAAIRSGHFEQVVSFHRPISKFFW